MEFTRTEQELVTSLVKTGFQVIPATIITVMATRTTGRARKQLVEAVLTGYPGLEDPTLTDLAVGRLLKDGWLIQTDASGVTLCQAAPNILSRLSDQVGEDVTHRLADVRALRNASVSMIGPMYDEAVERSVRQLVMTAQREIRLPFLATPASLELAADFEARASQGVRIRILIATEDLVVSLRGDAQRSRAMESIRGWANRTARWPRTEVRTTNDRQDILMAASASFDDARAVLAVYDIARQRSQQSTLIDVGEPGYVPNLVHLFNRHFDEAWSRARPVRGLDRLWWRLSRLGWETLLVASLVIAILTITTVPAVSNVAAGVAAAAFLTIALRFRESARRLYQRLRGVE
jgi:hypothetical protein